MANSVLINLKPNIDIEELKDGSILVYDGEYGDFYTVTKEAFFDKYEGKLNKLLERYDKKHSEIKKEIDELKRQQEKFINSVLEENNKKHSEIRKEIAELKRQYFEFTKSIKENNYKLIDMVEKFIKGE